MKGKTTVTRPNMKVTDFFHRKPKAGPRPDQPVYDISSSSDRSVISISSGDVPPRNGASQPALIAGPSTRVVTQAPSRSRQLGGTRSSGIYVTSPSQSSVVLVSSDRNLSPSPDPLLTRGNTRSDDVTLMSNPSSSQGVAAPKTPKINAKKRKQPPIHIISSEDSDGPVFPVIRVKPSSRDKAPSGPRSHSHSQPSISAVIASLSVPVPLSPRHNTLSPSKRPSLKPDPTAIQLSSRTKKSERHGQPASPLKRARHGSISMLDRRSPTPPGDADDERERDDEPTTSTQHQSWNIVSDIQSPLEDDYMDVDIPVASLSCPVPDNLGVKPCNEQTTPCEDTQNILPSSQQGETELTIDHEVADMNVNNVPERQHPVSPSKSRAEDVIARIKANAEAAADAQAQLESRRSIDLFGDKEDLSDLSSLSSLTDEDDEELDFELSIYNKASGRDVAKITGSATSVEVSPSMADTMGTRRSGRHANTPAPDYAKKLKLFRDDAPMPSKGKEKASANGKVKEQSEAASCPLDVLLRDHEREYAHREMAEKKRKRRPPMRQFSPAAPNHQSKMFQTPPRRRGSAETENSGSDVPSDLEGNKLREDSLMSDADREELLGKEDADAVRKILAGDRVKRSHGNREIGVVFWDAIQEGRKDVAPELVVNDGNSPVFQILCDKLNRGEYKAASLLINTGILAAVPHSVQLLEWLLLTAMSTADTALSTAAYRALLVLQREGPGASPAFQLTSDAILASLFKFGVNPQISTLLGTVTVEKTTVVEASQDTKVLAISRFVIVLETLGHCNAIHPDAIPSTILCLLLLALDPSAGQELQQDIVCSIESLLGSSIMNRMIELSVCKSIIHATTSLAFTPEQEARLLSFLSGCGHSSGRVKRWTAWAILGGDLSSVQESGDVPPLEVLTALFADKPVGSVRFEVSCDTDYEALAARVDVLSGALTDVDAYVRLDRSARGVSGASIEDICKALECMNGKIVDTRAANLDRTRAKDAINRLHKRLLYQRHATLELIRGNAGKMDRFVTKGSSPTAKPRPKPVPATMGNQDDVRGKGRRDGYTLIE